ncbi:MAG: SRPBCC domain-containing protein [Chlorobi bacterium]|nr:SRPBCC domain-containing protein [Chlorobiota bacterium]
METSHYHTVQVQRVVHGTPEEVWGAWTDSVKIAHWFTEEAEQDVRVGGRYRNSDGDEGTYLIVESPHRLKFTWDQPDYSPGSLVTVEISAGEEEGTTVVQVLHENIHCDDADDLQTGWQWGLDSLQRYMITGLGIRFEEWAAMQ